MPASSSLQQEHSGSRETYAVHLKWCFKGYWWFKSSYSKWSMKRPLCLFHCDDMCDVQSSTRPMQTHTELHPIVRISTVRHISNWFKRSSLTPHVTSVAIYRRDCKSSAPIYFLSRKSALMVLHCRWNDSWATIGVLAKQEQHSDYNQPDGCQEMFGCNWEGGERQISCLKFIFCVFNNPKLHKAVKLFERFTFHVYAEQKQYQ